MSSRLWAWDVSALFYSKTYGPLAHQLDEELFAYLGKDLEGAVVADCGCGPGIVSRKLVERGAGKVFAIDSNPQMLRQVPPLPQIVSVQAVAEEGILEKLCVQQAWEGFDLVLFKRSLYQDRPDALRLLRSTYQHLRPGGRIAIVHPERSVLAYAFGDPPRLHRHTPYHLFNRALSVFGVLTGAEQYALYTRDELSDLAAEVAGSDKVERIPSAQRAFNLIAIRRPAFEQRRAGR
jgi:SAM-dependent methyltransferase